MDRFLENTTAIVTGGTRGIGYAIAAALLEAGASVAICGRSAQSTEQAVTQLSSQSKSKVVGAVADVGKPDQVSTLFQTVDRELGSPGILVNNAGAGHFASVAELTIEAWTTTIETNLSGVFYCCHEALPRFKKLGGGYVINIGSLAGRNAFAGGAAYNASKFGLNGFSEAMMLDHRNDNVRVSCIMPGSVATEFGSGALSGADWKIAPQDIADIVISLLRMPARTLISRVEVRPSRPPK
jgi:NAD(P)-dependent dehydrogenase (short-subunit alcohol dehydrogenase family)